MLGLAIQEGTDPIQKIKAFRTKHHITYPLLSDEPAVIIQKFGFTGIPQCVVIDTTGKYVGAPNTVPELKALLKKLGKTP